MSNVIKYLNFILGKFNNGKNCYDVPENASLDIYQFTIMRDSGYEFLDLLKSFD